LEIGYLIAIHALDGYNGRVKTMTNFRLEKGYLEKLDELAKAHQRSRTGELKTALLEYFRKFDPAFSLAEESDSSD
jgi:hypothetical protein